MTIPSVTIHNQDSPNQVIFLCDHASNRVPDWIDGGSLGLPQTDMDRHIAYDVGAAGLTLALADIFAAPAVLSNFSRLVIDPNRGEDDPTMIMQLYDGSIIPANRGLVDADRTVACPSVIAPITMRSKTS